MLGFTILEPECILLWIKPDYRLLPALALGMEKAEQDIMRRPPRDANEGIFAGGMGFDIAVQGVLVTLITVAAYFIGHFMEAGVHGKLRPAGRHDMGFWRCR
jgi:Ca2+-transporting ATPase